MDEVEGVVCVRGDGEPHVVELMVREGCGACVRVAAQIEPVVTGAGCTLNLVDVDAEDWLAVESGDRVPVVVVDGEEFSCWEVDDAELAFTLLS